ncbi:MAG: hypothetical protein AUJ49_01250 [Desulfovibrionaceae bacterium CG1_02_65_16]|nr:MAG: hypothetical protein AUJ49_01250 [Desulfovibrionaceae bacterium CG1_02_65_16]
MQLRKRTCLAALALALGLCLCAQAASAATLSLQNLVVDNQSGMLAARFGISVESLAEVSDALTSGMTLSLTCKTRLTRRGGVFSNTQVAAADMDSRLKYDSLTKEFSLTLPGREAPLKNTRLDELLRVGWGTLSLEMGAWKTLEHGQEYTLTLDIRLHQVEIPNWFRRTLFFWSWDLTPQASYQLHFKP